MTRLAGLKRSFPTFVSMAVPFRWIARSRRRVCCAGLIVVSMLTAPPLWWMTQLVGLPDIGDPFDVAVFRAQTIPDDRNAFVLYREAVKQYKPLKSPDTSGQPVDVDADWSTAGSTVRRWVETNRDALALYRRAADRPDALDSSITSSAGGYAEFFSLGLFQHLALLEASRLEVQGDMTAAWGWYRTCLRTTHHVRLRSVSHRRMAALRWHSQLINRLTEWAANARTTAAQLHQALDDVIACEALVPSESFALKAEYFIADQMFQARNYRGRRLPPPWLIALESSPAIRSLGPILTPEQIRSISDAWAFWRREPERSQRVHRLITANRLAFYDAPPARRPRPDPDVFSCELYSFGPEAPAKARALSPAALGRWLDSTQHPADLIRLLNGTGLRTNELAHHRALVILLATELYRRDHGTDPPTPEALVGPYLKALPAEFPDEERNEASSSGGPAVD
jgi:hypothetical protein